jgi:hypothetical protein
MTTTRVSSACAASMSIFFVIDCLSPALGALKAQPPVC